MQLCDWMRIVSQSLSLSILCSLFSEAKCSHIWTNRVSISQLADTIGSNSDWLQRAVTQQYLTVLPGGRGDVPDAGRQLALSPLVGGVPGTVAGAPALFAVVVSASFSSTSTSSPCTSTSLPGASGGGASPVQAHCADLLLLLLLVAVQH